MKKHVGQIARFGLVGCTITGLNYLLYRFLIAHGVHYLVATTLGWMIGTAAAFFGNKYLTFLHDTGVDRQEITRFLLCYGSQWVLGSASIIVMIDGFGIDYNLAFVINVAITSCYSYFFMDRLVFFKRAVARSADGRSVSTSPIH